MSRISKRIAIIVAVASLLAAAYPSAFAEYDAPEKIMAAEAPRSYQGAPDASMEEALIEAKTLIGVDDEVYTDFGYSSSYSNYETMEGLMWYFYWSDNMSTGISATVAADATVLSFYKYDYASKSFGFAEIGREEAVAIADGFIRKASPATASYYEKPIDASIGLHDGAYSFTYYASVNGYPFDVAVISVSVDKYTGEVTGYSTRNIDPGRYSFEPATDLISKNAAVSAYAEKIGLSLEYRSYFDYESGTLTIYPAYQWNSYGDRYIGAGTGEVVHYVYDLGSDSGALAGGGAPSPYAANESAEDASSVSGGRASLTPAEKAAIEQVAGFITSEQALEKLLEAAGLDDADVSSISEQYIGLNRNYMYKDRYFYDINMYAYYDYSIEDGGITSLYGRVDALTGRVLSFSYYYGNMPYRQLTADEMAESDARAEAAINEFLNKQAPDEMGKSRLTYVSTPGSDRYGYVSGYYSYGYTRFENDVPFGDNSISATYNQYTGKITAYSLNWYDDAVFPSVANVLTAADALAVYADQIGMKLRYVTTGNSNVALAYDFNNYTQIDPYSGTALNYNGEQWANNAVTPEYGDVAGHWAEKYVMKLLDNGVYMWGGPFMPDKTMTELEFLQYIMLIERSYISPALTSADTEAFYRQRGVEVKASADKNVTKQEAARIIAEYLGYGKIAGQGEYFLYPFNDEADTAYKGYITICYMLGIVGGDNGSFDAATVITRAHAAGLLHNLILAQSA